MRYNISVNECLFCKLAQDPSKLVWENEVAAAFKDIHPKAPVHVLVVTKKHVDSIDRLDDPELTVKMVNSVKEVAKKVGVAGNYRIIVNTGPHAGRVEHLHFHILGGNKLDE